MVVIYAGDLRIGILGGIGPEATILYLAKLYSSLPQTGLIRGNTDYPRIKVNFINAPELVGAISQEQLEPYKSGLKELDGLFVDLIVMVCNTIHLYHAELQSEVRTPIMDLRQKVKERLVRDGVRTLTVLGTPSTIRQDR